MNLYDNTPSTEFSLYNFMNKGKKPLQNCSTVLLHFEYNCNDNIVHTNKQTVHTHTLKGVTLVSPFDNLKINCWSINCIKHEQSKNKLLMIN